MSEGALCWNVKTPPFWMLGLNVDGKHINEPVPAISGFRLSATGDLSRWCVFLAFIRRRAEMQTTGG